MCQECLLVDDSAHVLTDIKENRQGSVSICCAWLSAASVHMGAFRTRYETLQFPTKRHGCLPRFRQRTRPSKWVNPNLSPLPSSCFILQWVQGFPHYVQWKLLNHVAKHYDWLGWTHFLALLLSLRRSRQVTSFSLSHMKSGQTFSILSQ